MRLFSFGSQAGVTSETALVYNFLEPDVCEHSESDGSPQYPHISYPLSYPFQLLLKFPLSCVLSQRGDLGAQIQPKPAPDRVLPRR